LSPFVVLEAVAIHCWLVLEPSLVVGLERVAVVWSPTGLAMGGACTKTSGWSTMVQPRINAVTAELAISRFVDRVPTTVAMELLVVKTIKTQRRMMIGAVVFCLYYFETTT
jgi:hypothetical protein